MEIDVEVVTLRDGVRIVREFYDCTNRQAEKIVKLWNDNNSIINYLDTPTYYTMYEWLYVSEQNGYSLSDIIDI